MVLTALNVDDLNKLNQYRIERFLQFFTSALLSCRITLKEGNALVVDCPQIEVVDELLDDLEDLRSYAWLILGVRRITFHFCQEEVFCTDTSTLKW